MHEIATRSHDFMALWMDCDPKMAKAHETSTKRLARVINKYRAEGMTDLQLGVMIGFQAQHRPMLIATLSMLAEIEGEA